MSDFRPAEALLLNACLVWGVIVVVLGALIALWARRGHK
jgi:hypothetical protein